MRAVCFAFRRRSSVECHALKSRGFSADPFLDQLPRWSVKLDTRYYLITMKKHYVLTIEAILEAELYTNPSLMRVVVADLAGEKNSITKLYKLTKNLTALEKLKHLRRVRNTEDGRIECIVCRLNPGDDCETFLEEIRATFQEESLVLENYRVIEVPSQAPRTEQQLEACSKFWPTKYAKSNYLNQCIEGSIIDDTEKLVLRIVTDSLLAKLNGDHEGDSNLELTSAAVVFRYNKVYGVGLSCCSFLRENPMKHSSLIAIDSVAKNAGGGHWAPTMHLAGEALALEIQKQLDNRAELKEHKMPDDFLHYICTNYDIVITEEPCVMCTMALVQSRIRRLFYLDAKSLVDHAQLSTWRPVCYPDRAIEEFLVHRDKSINHRFEAWRIKIQPIGGH